MKNSERTNYCNNFGSHPAQTDRETDEGVVKQGTGCASGPVTTTGMLTLLQYMGVKRVGSGEQKKDNLATRTIQYIIH